MVAAESSFDNVYSVCGFAGGLLFALALGPQVVHTLKTRSAEDISLYWYVEPLITVLVVANLTQPVSFARPPLTLHFLPRLCLMITHLIRSLRNAPHSSSSSPSISAFFSRRQGLYLVGLGSWITYSVFNSLWPVAGPQFMEFSLMALLTILKIVFDTWPKAKSARSDVDIDGSVSNKDKKPPKIPREVSAASRSMESLIMDTASTTVDTEASALSLPGLDSLPSSNDMSPEKGGSEAEDEERGHTVVELADVAQIESVMGAEGGQRRVLHFPDE